MTERRQPPVLKAHANVTSLTDERRARAQPDPHEWVLFIDPPPPPGSRAAQAQAEGLALYLREQEARNAPPAAPERRWRPGWLRAILGLARRSRPS